MRVHGGGAPRCHTTAGFGNALPDARCRVRVRLRAGPGAPHSPCCPERRARPHPLRAPPAPSNRTAPVARRDRIVVSTLRCGRSNLGSNPSHGIASARRYHGIRACIFFSYFLLFSLFLLFFLFFSFPYLVPSFFFFLLLVYFPSFFFVSSFFLLLFFLSFPFFFSFPALFPFFFFPLFSFIPRTATSESRSGWESRARCERE